MDKTQLLHKIAEEILVAFTGAVNGCDDDPEKFLLFVVESMGELNERYGEELFAEAMTYTEDIPILNLGANTLIEMIQSGEKVDLKKMLN